MHIGYVCSQETENPTDISRDEGEEAVRIPCELVFSSIQNRMIFWRINGIDYTINNLPSIYTQTLSGLRIERVTLAMNGTSFQCLLPTDNDLAVQASSIGVLTVIPQTGNGILIYIIIASCINYYASFFNINCHYEER